MNGRVFVVVLVVGITKETLVTLGVMRVDVWGQRSRVCMMAKDSGVRPPGFLLEPATQ